MENPSSDSSESKSTDATHPGTKDASTKDASTKGTGTQPTEAKGEPAKGRWKLGPLDLTPPDLSAFARRITQLLDFSGGEHEDQDGASFQQLRDFCREAYEKRGKLAGLLAIAKVADAYGRLDHEGRDAFFHMLKTEFAVEPTELEAAMAAYRDVTRGSAAAEIGQTDADQAEIGQTDVKQAGATVEQAKALVRLNRALESPRHTLFKQFNTIPQGIKFLVDLRADLYPRLKQDPTLLPLEYELRRLLEAFFNLGFLHLSRIGWDSPAVLLENLIRYEAVNRISNWDDLKHRLVSDRACFAFIHPAMPDEPVIFVEVALTRGMADSIQHLLDPEAPDLPPDQADTAIFYGISNAQAGLSGIPFGNLLIKQVATRLRGEVPNLRTFATLSPLPRFRRNFLEPAVADGSIAGFFQDKEAQALREAAEAETVPEAVGKLLGIHNWFLRPRLADTLRPGLLRAVRHYLAHVRRDGHAACPVAHFHGSNGALLARVNWLADTSNHGLTQSAGLMVNYLYDMERFETHQEQYLLQGTLALSKAVQEL